MSSNRPYWKNKLSVDMDAALAYAESLGASEKQRLEAALEIAQEWQDRWDELDEMAEQNS